MMNYKRFKSSLKIRKHLNLSISEETFLKHEVYSGSQLHGIY